LQDFSLKFAKKATVNF